MMGWSSQKEARSVEFLCTTSSSTGTGTGTGIQVNFVASFCTRDKQKTLLQLLLLLLLLLLLMICFADDYTLIPSSPQNFTVDKILPSTDGTFLALAGPKGVSIIELPRRWGPNGQYQNGKECIICRTPARHAFDGFRFLGLQAEQAAQRSAAVALSGCGPRE
uniref:Uncharacterized protein n=1 Tax=Anopheles albimanus TaxID=7167 RepID=A0A182FS76_ANOAL